MISGTAPDKIETRWLHETREQKPSSKGEDSTARVDAHKSSSKLDEAIVREEARIALVGMGWKPMIARSAIEAAASHMGRDAPLQAWVRQALRHCPLPRS
jgi:Holliday junction resolvasome RuvABC DNA-binding subunit